MERLSRNPVLVVKPSKLPTILPKPTKPLTAVAKDERSASESDIGHGPLGRGVATTNRRKACGEESSPASIPAKGTFRTPFASRIPFEFGESSSRSFASVFHGGGVGVDCPQFDGENPRAWKMKCETYFRVSGVSPEVWVGVAALQFIGGALTWLQSTNAHVELMSWSEFAEAVCAKFGREEFQSLIRQFNRVRQIGSVLSYAEKFNELMHQLYVHHSSWNLVFFVTEFLDGLKPEIRSAVLLHSPADMDTVVDLACLQEEVLATGRCELRWVEAVVVDRAGQRPRGNGGRTDDKMQPIEDRVAALRAYRKAKGLCHKCGEKWSSEHKCGPTVQLHVVGELLELLDESDDRNVPDETEDDCDTEPDQISEV